MNRFEGHQGKVQSACFDITGAHVLTASEDRTVRLWSVEKGDEIAALFFDHSVTSLATRDKLVLIGDAGGRWHLFELKAEVGRKDIGPAQITA